MNNRNCILFFLIICQFFLNQCSSESEKGVNGNNIIQRGDLLYYQNEDIPYTGKFHGNDRSYYYEGFILDGKKDGKFTIWFENKKKFHESHYKNGKLHGKYTEWYSTGKIKQIKYYSNGKLVEKN